MIYHAKATLQDGTVLETYGFITDISAWADKVIRNSEGNVQIDITRQVNWK